MVDTSGLNDAQRDAVFHDRGPLLVLAGAGSGKTRVVTTRIARLLMQGESPRTILAVTFTNKASKEMKERLVALCGRPARGVWVSTFHALCARLLRRDAHRIGLSPGFAILDEGDQLGQLQKTAKGLDIKLTEKEPRMVLSRIGFWKNQGLRRDQEITDAGGDPMAILAARLWQPYASHLRALSALDFDDLLLYARELLESVPDVRKRYQALLRFIHIDEYQDTNPIQLDITRLLLGPEKNICVVGDDDQAIYAFRGADLENILSFDTQFAPCKVVKLEQNYRSTALILDSANAVIQKNAARKDKTLYSALGDGRPVEVLACEDGDAEAENVGARIFEYVNTQKVPGHEIAILYRAAPQSRLFEESLRLRGIPYRVIGGMEFFARKEVKDTLAYVACIARSDDELALRRALTAPARGVGEKSLERIMLGAKEQQRPLLEFCAEGAPGVPLKDAQRDALTSFASPLIEVRAAVRAAYDNPEGDVADVVRRAIDQAGLAELLQEETDLPARERLQESIEEVLNALASFVDRLRDAAESPDLEESHMVDASEGPLAAFLDRVALDEDKEKEKDNKNEKNQEKKNKGKVQLMSLHASKGLEFPVVFMVGLEEGLMPHRRVVEESGERGVSEERRLMYVGITRAQKTLICTHAKMRRKRHEMIGRRRCRFLDDIPARCLMPVAEVTAPTVDSAEAFFEQMRMKLGGNAPTT